MVEAPGQGHCDRGVMRAFGQMGLLGLTSPVEYGGGGAGYVSYGLGARAVEQVDSGYRFSPYLRISPHISLTPSGDTATAGACSSRSTAGGSLSSLDR